MIASVTLVRGGLRARACELADASKPAKTKCKYSATSILTSQIISSYDRFY